MTRSYTEKFSRFCAVVIVALTLCFVLPLALWSLLYSVTVTTGGGEGEIVTIVSDALLPNLLITAAALAVLFLLRSTLDRIPLRALVVILMLWVLVFGGAFVCSAKLQPTQDPYIIGFFARQAARGDFSYYNEYFRFFPYQFGFALYEELFFRLFDLVLPNAPEGFSSVALQLLNVLYVAAAYFFVVKICGCVFKSERVQKYTVLLLLLFLPPVLSATLMYGSIPSFTFGLLSLWFFLLYRESEKTVFGVLTAPALCLAVLFKLNALIFLIALGIVWLICLLQKPSFRSALCLVLLLAAVLLVKPLPQKLYEKRTGTDFGGGVPQWGWMAMGLSEGQSSFGWYDPKYTTSAYADLAYDADAASDYAKEAISAQLAEFKKSPTTALRLFARKVATQWGVPDAQSLWTNQVRPSYSSFGKLYNLVCVDADDAMFSYMNIVHQLILVLFTVGLFLLLRRKCIIDVLLPLVVLGAFLYHLIFEAKAQYALCYYLLMLPTAAFALDSISRKKERDK